MSKNPKTSMIFGLFGQDSYYLSNLLIDRGDTVIGCHRHTYLPTIDFDSRVNLVYCDMMDPKSIKDVLNEYEPHEVYNLAAHSFVGDSFNNPSHVINNNVNSHLNLLEAVRSVCPRSKIYYSGSSEEFTLSSPYGISKHTVKVLNDLYRELYGIFICHAQNFNHTSWRHSPQFLFPKVTRYVANLSTWLTRYKLIDNKGPILQGQCIYGNANFSWLNKLELGDLSASKSIGYAEDFMRAAILMMEQDESGLYSVSETMKYNMEEVVRMCFEEFNLNYKDFIIQNKSLFRPSITMPPYSAPISIYSSIKELGWKPSMGLRELIHNTINEYIERGIK